MNSLNFGKDTSRDKYAEFLQDYADYIQNKLEIRLAKNVANSSWHLVDWVYQENLNTHNYTNIGDFRESLYSDCKSLKIMHDIANSSKHMTLSRRKSDVSSSSEYQGDFDPNDFDSDDYNVSFLQLTKDDGTSLNFEKELGKVKSFWDDYFIAL